MAFVIVRLSNKEVTAQIAYDRIEGVRVVCAAYSHEFPKFDQLLQFTALDYFWWNARKLKLEQLALLSLKT